MGNKIDKGAEGEDRGASLGTSLDLINPSPSIANLSFFYKDLSRSQAEDIMRRHAEFPGTYLLRISSQHRRYALTVIAAKNRIGHILIYCPNEGCFYAEKEYPFDSMGSLIEYYKTHPLPNVTDTRIETNLKNPVHRFRQQFPFPFQKDAVEYQLVTDKIYSWVENREDVQKRQNEENLIYFYEDGRRVMMRSPPCPPPDTGEISYMDINDSILPTSSHQADNDEYVTPETLPNQKVNSEPTRFKNYQVKGYRDDDVTFSKSVFCAQRPCASTATNPYANVNVQRNLNCKTSQNEAHPEKNQFRFSNDSSVYSTKDLHEEADTYCDVADYKQSEESFEN